MKNDKRYDQARRDLLAFQRETEASRAHLVNLINTVSSAELDQFFDEPGESPETVLNTIEGFLERAEAQDPHAKLMQVILQRMAWRQKDLAERLGVRSYSVSRWTRGECAPKAQVWVDIWRTLLDEGVVAQSSGPALLVALVEADLDAVRGLLPRKETHDE